MEHYGDYMGDAFERNNTVERETLEEFATVVQMWDDNGLNYDIGGKKATD